MIDSAKLTSWYDFQAPLYHLWRDQYESPMVKEFLSNLESSNDEYEVLDAGCGTGLFSIAVAKSHPTWIVTGVDLSRGMLKVASRMAKKFNLENVRFSLGSVTQLPAPPESFDIIIAAGLFPNVVSCSEVLLELNRVLKPSGKLIIAEFDRSQMSKVTKLFFKLMLFGYKLFSTVFQKFRFSKNWDINSSTIEPAVFKQQLTDAGLRLEEVKSVQSHLLFNCSKQEARDV